MSLRIYESILSVWSYHLRNDEEPERFLPALCGAKVMTTEIPIGYWNKTPKDYHIPEKWCAECEKLSGIKGHEEEKTDRTNDHRHR